MPTLFYHKLTIIGKLHEYFSPYFRTLTRPTAQLLAWITIAMIALQGVPSLRRLYLRFLSGIHNKSLEALYYACKHANLDASDFAAATIQKVLSLLPPELEHYPCFLLLDDTLIPKFGKSFDHVRTLFDHAAKEKHRRYINGHCFVSLSLGFPMFQGRERFVEWITVPLCCRVWDGQKTKLDLADSMVRKAMKSMGNRRTVLLCDSWYATKSTFSMVQSIPSLEIVCNVRCNARMHRLEITRKGTRGPLPKQGELIHAEDITSHSIRLGDLTVTSLEVTAEIANRQKVYAFVTTSESGSKRLFFSTLSRDALNLEEFPPAQMDLYHWSRPEVREHRHVLNYLVYSQRWAIETGFYEMKAFWDLEAYMVRRAKSMETLGNLIHVAYAAMRILPWTCEELSHLRWCSPQDVRYAISEQIHEQRILCKTLRCLDFGEFFDIMHSRMASLICRYKNTA